MNDKYNIIFLEKPRPIGGPGSFQVRLTETLSNKGISTSIRRIQKDRVNIVLVFAGSKRWIFLLKCKLMGIKIVHRLDGLNWQHRVETKTSLKYFIKAEVRQFLVSGIRRLFANHVIYISEFVRDVWEHKSKYKISSSLIYNGSPLQNTSNSNRTNRNGFIAVEGRVNGAVAYKILSHFKYPIDIYGDYDRALAKDLPSNVCFKGPVPRDQIHNVLPSYLGYLCLETLPACPNSVIEALSHGVPVCGVNNGSLSELVGDAGILIDDTGDPSKLEIDNPTLINDAAKQLLEEAEILSKRAINRHKTYFNIEDRVDQYVSVLTAK